MSSEHDLNMRRGGLDYDMYVINPNNSDTTFGQLRDCMHDALEIIDGRLRVVEEWIRLTRRGEDE